MVIEIVVFLLQIPFFLLQTMQVMHFVASNLDLRCLLTSCFGTSRMNHFCNRCDRQSRTDLAMQKHNYHISKSNFFALTLLFCRPKVFDALVQNITMY